MSSEDIILEIYPDDDIFLVYMGDGRVYSYEIDEIQNDWVDRIISGGAEYTIYSQREEVIE